ncbi:MAG TPA: type II toxin-antitoxin system HicA family toxin [Candidatus Absconditabacterales bacterium]|nr:type II toxin-antitoxin system HicA family toxin [Candidatus Absconditabacterales bacterium]HOQ79299.1 type II toxin-antitoxin system HicA family toxin [Candidatus Absconditabacterales bacterium]HPK28327.1 type II toxin-antitoxin system HicA family toxin [Candidatus Absconditabacterales bacterium]
MPKVTPINARELVKKLRKLGFEGPYVGGKHMFMMKDGYRVPFPNHGGKDISRGVVNCIIEYIGISVDERNSL